MHLLIVSRGLIKCKSSFLCTHTNHGYFFKHICLTFFFLNFIFRVCVTPPELHLRTFEDVFLWPAYWDILYYNECLVPRVNPVIKYVYSVLDHVKNQITTMEMSSQ